MNIPQKMRLTVCIAVCLCGFLIMGHLFGVEILQTLYAKIESAFGAKLLLLFAAAFMVVFGAAGIKLPMRTPPSERKIIFHSEYGDIEIQLNSVERNIQRVLKKLPEIYKVKVRVFADETQEHAIVEADCVLCQNPDTPEHARQVAKRIGGYIALMARKTMGLEELATIKVNVVNVHYDGPDIMSSLFEDETARQDPILLEHDQDELEVVDARAQLANDFAFAPTPFFAQSAREDLPEAQEEAEEEPAAMSAGPALGNDLGSDFDDFDFNSIHDASGDDEHEISQAGFAMPEATEDEHPKDAGVEPDFKIVDMRVKAIEEEQAEEKAAEAAAIAKPAAKQSPPKKAKGRKGKKR